MQLYADGSEAQVSHVVGGVWGQLGLAVGPPFRECLQSRLGSQFRRFPTPPSRDNRRQVAEAGPRRPRRLTNFPGSPTARKLESVTSALTPAPTRAAPRHRNPVKARPAPAPTRTRAPVQPGKLAQRRLLRASIHHPRSSKHSVNYPYAACEFSLPQGGALRYPRTRG